MNKLNNIINNIKIIQQISKKNFHNNTFVLINNIIILESNLYNMKIKRDKLLEQRNKITNEFLEILDNILNNFFFNIRLIQ